MRQDVVRPSAGSPLATAARRRRLPPRPTHAGRAPPCRASVRARVRMNAESANVPRGTCLARAVAAHGAPTGPARCRAAEGHRRARLRREDQPLAPCARPSAAAHLQRRSAQPGRGTVAALAAMPVGLVGGGRRRALEEAAGRADRGGIDRRSVGGNRRGRRGFDVAREDATLQPVAAPNEGAVAPSSNRPPPKLVAIGGVPPATSRTAQYLNSGIYAYGSSAACVSVLAAAS